MADEEAVTSHDDREVIIQCKCKIKNTDYDVCLTETDLKWYLADNNKLKGLQVVSVCDIFSVILNNSTGSEVTTNSVSVSYVIEGKNCVLKLSCLKFSSDDSQMITNLYQQISTLIKKINQRPRKLLVLINPVSGRSKGRSTYEQKVAPIFKDAGIETDVKVTERAHHTEEILATYDLKSVCGISWLVLVGGDGLYQEGVNSLMRRQAAEHNVNLDDPNETLPAIDINIGLIPCGTGNGVALGCYGNDDVITAALAIAIGYKSPANMLSVHSDGKLIAYSILMVGYGFWGDVILSAESRRNQGVLRYPIAMAEHMFLKTQRRLELTIQHYCASSPAQNDNIKSESQLVEDISNLSETTTEIKTMLGAEVGTNSINYEPTITSTTKENVTAMVVFVNSDTCSFTRTTRPDLSQTAMYLNKSSERTKFISFMFRLMTLNFRALESRDDIMVLSGQEWKIKLEEPSPPDTRNSMLEHIINIDGEVYRLPKLEFHTKLLTDKITLFSNMPYITKRLQTS